MADKCTTKTGKPVERKFKAASLGDAVLFMSEKHYLLGIVAGIDARGMTTKARLFGSLDGEPLEYTLSAHQPKWVVPQATLKLGVEEVVRAAPMWSSRELATQWLKNLRADEKKSSRSRRGRR